MLRSVRQLSPRRDRPFKKILQRDYGFGIAEKSMMIFDDLARHACTIFGIPAESNGTGDILGGMGGDQFIHSQPPQHCHRLSSTHIGTR